MPADPAARDLSPVLRRLATMWQSILLLLLILVNGFFSMAELAVVSARRARLQARADAGDVGAARALALAEDPSRFLSAVQIGITLIAILTGVIGEAAFSTRLAEVLEGFPAVRPYAAPLASAIVVVVVGYLTLVLGELVPKRIALAGTDRIAARVAIPLAVFAAVARPFVVLLSLTSSGILKLLRIREEDAPVTEEEVKTTIAEGVAAGAIAPEERRMMEGVLRLADRPVRAIMTPRGEVDWIDADDDPEVLKAEIGASPRSRIVVGEDGSIDEPLGVIRKKDLLDAALGDRPFDLRASILQPIYVPDNASVLRLLDLMKTTPVQLAFVVDEFGSFEGIVTATDILEAIAGSLPEEHGPEARDIVPRDDGSFLVDGRISVDEFIEHFPLDRPEGDYHTAAGLMLTALGRIPTEGDSVVLAPWRLEVVDMDGRRIDKLLVAPYHPAEED